MPSATPILDVRRAQAEAANRALDDWQPPEDPARRASAVEGIVRGLLNTPRELRDVVKNVFESEPRDGALLEYMNRHQAELHKLFDSAFSELVHARKLAHECVAAGQSIPSLPALEKAIHETEEARSDTLAHWIEFAEGPIEIRPEDYISNDEAFAIISEGRDSEILRELQSRLEQLNR